ncbi:hypothetical protein D3C73_1135790 [compost metagenome]
MRVRGGLQFRSRDIEQRAQQTALPQSTLARHPGQPPHPCPTQQPEQQGFGLIVTVLASQQQLMSPGDLDECGIPSVAGRLFKAGAGLDLNMDDSKRDTLGITHRLAVLGPGVGGGLQPVMDVNGRKGRQRMGLSQRGQQVQQNGGIEATGEGDAPGCGIAPWSETLQKPGS